MDQTADRPRPNADALTLLATCMAEIGEAGFNRVFLNLTDEQLSADQVMVFSYHGPTPTCYLSFNRHPDRNANLMAQDYLASGHQNDPMIPQIDQLKDSNGTDIFLLSQLRPAMSADYHRHYYGQLGIVDKLTVLTRRDGQCIGINLYRLQGTGPFECGIADDPLLPVLGQLALLHFARNDRRDLLSPLMSLSAREREICKGILGGKTNDAIAWDLQVAPSTVTTYRRRAYAKLGINSKSALFTLCGADD